MAMAESVVDRLTWKDVLSSRPSRAPWYGHIDKFLTQAVAPSGYAWFEWNGRVYEVQGFKELSYRDTGLLAAQLDERRAVAVSRRVRFRRWWRNAIGFRHVLAFVLGLGAWTYLCLTIAFVAHATPEVYALIIVPPLVLGNVALAIRPK